MRLYTHHIITHIPDDAHSSPDLMYRSWLTGIIIMSMMSHLFMIKLTQIWHWQTRHHPKISTYINHRHKSITSEHITHASEEYQSKIQIVTKPNQHMSSPFRVCERDASVWLPPGNDSRGLGFLLLLSALIILIDNYKTRHCFVAEISLSQWFITPMSIMLFW